MRYFCICDLTDYQLGMLTRVLLRVCTYISQLVRKRQSVISGEGPYLPTRCCQLADHRRHEAEDNRHKHEDGSSSAPCRVQKDRDKGRLGAIGKDFIEIAGTEYDGDTCNETHDRVQDIGDYECPRNGVRGVFSVFSYPRCQYDPKDSALTLDGILMCTALS